MISAEKSNDTNLLKVRSGEPRGLEGSTDLLPLLSLLVDCRLLGGLGSSDWAFLDNCWGTLSVEALRTRDMRAFRTVSMNREPLPEVEDVDMSFEVGLTGQLPRELAVLAPRNSEVFVVSSSARLSSRADLVRNCKDFVR